VQPVAMRKCLFLNCAGTPESANGPRLLPSMLGKVVTVVLLFMEEGIEQEPIVAHKLPKLPLISQPKLPQATTSGEWHSNLGIS